MIMGPSLKLFKQGIGVNYSLLFACISPSTKVFHRSENSIKCIIDDCEDQTCLPSISFAF